MDGKPGNEPKGAEILKSIIPDRVPRRHKKIMKKAKKELSEKQKAFLAKQHAVQKEAIAKDPSKRFFGSNDPNRKKEEPEVEPPEDDSDDGILNAKEIKLREDLKWVLAKLGGRNKILKRAKKSEALQDVIIKELLKVEVKEMEARLRLKIPQGQNSGFFFVISGLKNDAEKLKTAMPSGADLKFLESVINPEGQLIDIKKEEEE
jgi:hypothetical protein